MGIWGTDEFALTEAQMTGSAELVRGRGATSGSRATRALAHPRGARAHQRAAPRLPARTRRMAAGSGDRGRRGARDRPEPGAQLVEGRPAEAQAEVAIVELEPV